MKRFTTLTRIIAKFLESKGKADKIISKGKTSVVAIDSTKSDVVIKFTTTPKYTMMLNSVPKPIRMSYIRVADVFPITLYNDTEIKSLVLEKCNHSKLHGHLTQVRSDVRLFNRLHSKVLLDYADSITYSYMHFTFEERNTEILNNLLKEVMNNKFIVEGHKELFLSIISTALSNGVGIKKFNYENLLLDNNGLSVICGIFQPIPSDFLENAYAPY